jgi:hypothetical protein
MKRRKNNSKEFRTDLMPYLSMVMLRLMEEPRNPSNKRKRRKREKRKTMHDCNTIKLNRINFIAKESYKYLTLRTGCCILPLATAALKHILDTVAKITDMRNNGTLNV